MTRNSCQSDLTAVSVFFDKEKVRKKRALTDAHLFCRFARTSGRHAAMDKEKSVQIKSKIEKKIGRFGQI